MLRWTKTTRADWNERAQRHAAAYLDFHNRRRQRCQVELAVAKVTAVVAVVDDDVRDEWTELTYCERTLAEVCRCRALRWHRLLTWSTDDEVPHLNQSVDQSTNQSTNQPTNQPPTNQPVNQSHKQSVNQLINQSIIIFLIQIIIAHRHNSIQEAHSSRRKGHATFCVIESLAKSFKATQGHFNLRY